jgi:putative acetyltransferase
MLRVVAPSSETEINEVRALMRGFVQWHRTRHADDLDLIGRYFDSAAFEEELASLPGRYAPPHGALFLATFDARAAGCVALRRISDDVCEMKRMYVYPDVHGKGVGRALAAAVIDKARALGYNSMVLDTSVRQAEAQGLYRRFGFQIIPPYYELPRDIREWLVFMELKLNT